MNDIDLHFTYCSKSQWMEIMPVPTCCKLHAHNYTCIPIILGQRGTLDPTGQLVKFDLDLGDGSDTIILLCKTSRWPPVAILYFSTHFLALQTTNDVRFFSNLMWILYWVIARSLLILVQIWIARWPPFGGGCSRGQKKKVWGGLSFYAYFEFDFISNTFWTKMLLENLSWGVVGEGGGGCFLILCLFRILCYFKHFVQNKRQFKVGSFDVFCDSLMCNTWSAPSVM